MPSLANRKPPGNVSRQWVRRYTRPRDADGRFTAGVQLYERWDGQTRWLRHSFDPVDENCARALFLTDEARRILTDLFVIAVVALLLWLAW